MIAQASRRGVLAALLAAATALPAAAAREFIDDAGRKVSLPDRVERVYAAGPPASVLVFALAPDTLIGWTRAFKEDEIPWIAQKYAQLPELGRLTGRGNSANVEVVLKAKPDLIVDMGSTSATFASLADRIQSQTGIPYVLLDGRLETTTQQIEKLATVLGVPERGRDLAGYSKRLIDKLQERIATVPKDQRPQVYYARGPQGLTTGLAGSINVEMIEFLGAVNVAGSEKGGLANVGLEQVVLWDPAIIVTNDPNFYREVWKLPVWNSVTAVRTKRVYLSPHLPFGWFDYPPGANRLVGLLWLSEILYPQLFRHDLKREAAEFYRRFYHQAPNDEQLARLLGEPRRRTPMIVARARFPLWFGVACVALLLLILWSFSVGRFPVAPGDVWRALWSALTGEASGLASNVEAIVLQVRAPRVAGALAVGAALAAAGAAYQSLFKNPLVSPDILGVTAGCALGAGIAVLLSLPIGAIQALAFVGGLIAVGLVVAISSWIGGRDPLLTLVLTGVVVGSLFGAGIALVKYVADPYNQLPAITFWLLGSFTGALPRDLPATLIPIAVGLVPLALLRWRIDVLSLSEDEARSLGLRVGLLRFVVIVCATLATAAAVSLAGTIGWVGLVIPHAARLLVGAPFARVLPLSLVLGAAFMLGVDTVCRTAFGTEIPPGVATAFVGTPVFILLLAISFRRGT